jgi:hypothetical protein
VEMGCRQPGFWEHVVRLRRSLTDHGRWKTWFFSRGGVAALNCNRMLLVASARPSFRICSGEEASNTRPQRGVFLSGKRYGSMDRDETTAYSCTADIQLTKPSRNEYGTTSFFSSPISYSSCPVDAPSNLNIANVSIVSPPRPSSFPISTTTLI